MAHATNSVTVDAPIADVFAFLADGTNNARWRPEVVAVSHTSGEGLGAVFAQSMKGPGGRTITGDYKIITYEPPTRLGFEVVAGPARPQGSFVLSAVTDQTTEVMFTLDVKPRGLMVLMSPMINKQVRAEVANLDNLPAALRA